MLQVVNIAYVLSSDDSQWFQGLGFPHSHTHMNSILACVSFYQRLILFFMHTHALVKALRELEGFMIFMHFIA